MLTITEFKSVFLRSLVALLRKENFNVVRKDSTLVFYAPESEGIRAAVSIEYNIDSIGYAYSLYSKGEPIFEVVRLAKEEIYKLILACFKENE